MGDFLKELRELHVYMYTCSVCMIVQAQRGEVSVGFSISVAFVYTSTEGFFFTFSLAVSPSSSRIGKGILSHSRSHASVFLMSVHPVLCLQL